MIFYRCSSIRCAVWAASRLSSTRPRRPAFGPTGHVGIADLRNDPQRVAGAAAEVGISQLFMPAYPPPGVLSTAIYSFLLTWNDYLVALVFLRSDS